MAADQTQHPHPQLEEARDSWQLVEAGYSWQLVEVRDSWWRQVTASIVEAGYIW